MINLLYYNFKSIFSLLHNFFFNLSIFYNIFYCCWLNYVSPWFFFHYFSYEYISEVVTFPLEPQTLSYRVGIWLFGIFLFVGYTLRPPLDCWSLWCFFIWHHLIMVPKGQGMKTLLLYVIRAILCLIVSSVLTSHSV